MDSKLKIVTDITNAFSLLMILDYTQDNYTLSMMQVNISCCLGAI